MKRKTLLFVSIVVMMVMAISAAIPNAAQAAPLPKTRQVDTSSNGIYIIQMIDEPVVAYEGGITGLAATAPQEGDKIDPFSSTVTGYATYLVGQHDKALKKTGGQKLYDYTYSFNGFAAKLNAGQAKKMAALEGVRIVTPDQLQTVDTSSTPSFLGLDAPGGLWDQLGGTENAGEGIIIGVIDSGIWPESKSFTDRDSEGKLVFQQIPGWHGKCVPGEAYNASMCNQKLIGAQYFNAAWGGNKGIDATLPWEFNSARDYNGHGTHTSSTAGGNFAVPVTGPAAAFGTVNGMAPRARIAMYKALWSKEDASTANGYNSDLVAAIDQAVADGVDVLNYSISGSLTNFLDPVMVSFLYAARAGIFVSTSAGNSGPATSTVAHPGPWVTTVAAGTHNRSMIGRVELGNAVTYTGSSTNTTEVTAPLINSSDAGKAGAIATAVKLCFSSAVNGGIAALDPAKVAGKIVVCDRGSNARVDKSLAVKEAGGVGMILLNPTPNSLNADFHSVPTVHLQSTVYSAVHAYAATADATATIFVAEADYTTPAPYTASFSSRGPLLAGNGDLLKPDLIAPGQDILAAVSPVGNSGLNFNLYSGTSMSAPHVAGIAALLKQAHPTWTPMMIKSALMTSAYDILDGPNNNPLVIFRQGAGHIDPNKAVDPGLVYNAGWNNWLAFLCGTTNGISAGTCAALQNLGYSLDPSDLNVASISIGALAGEQTITRRVTNVGTETSTYTASWDMDSFGVEVTPSTLTLAPGQSKSFTVKFTNEDAPLNAYSGGYLYWSDTTHDVRIPIVINSVALAAPASVFGTGAPISYNVVFGYDGPFTAAPSGLIPATTFAGSINTGQQLTYQVVVPSGTTYARFSLFDANVSPASDLDLVVYRGVDPKTWVIVGSSGGGTSAEEVNLLNPTADTYTVLVDGYATANPSTFTLFTWVLGTASAGNTTVTAPANAVLAQSGTIDLTFSGLAAGTKYLGSIVYGGTAGMPNPTIVRVDMP